MESEPGVDMHVWRTRYAALEDDLADDPVASLSELLDLVEDMLAAGGYDLDLAGPMEEPAVTASLARARELVERVDAAEEVRADDAQQAAAGLRELYRGLLHEPQAESRPDLGGSA
jgi:predicted secreted protein